MDRQEGYYWVKYKGDFKVSYWDSEFKKWFTIAFSTVFEDSDFEHINEVKIKEPGELPE